MNELKVEINGEEVVVSDLPEYKEALESVRKQEKEKLYSQISRLEEQVKDVKKSGADVSDLQSKLQETKKTLDKTSKELEELRSTAGNHVKSNADTPDVQAQIDAAVKKAASEIKKEFSTQFNEQISGLTQTVTGLKDTIAQKDLEIYRQKLIADNGGSVIPELIQGTTIEELDKSIEKAKEAFENVSKKVKETLEVKAPTAPIPGNRTHSLGNGDDNILLSPGMARKDFSEVRETARKQIFNNGR